MTWLLSTPIAHRGLHDRAAGVPENSFAAAEAAIAQGWPIELDIRVLRDGEVVVFHDDDLDRLTGASGATDALDWEAMKDLRLLGTTQPVPRLADYLALVRGRAPLVIEVKNLTTEVGRWETRIKALLDRYRFEAAIISFNPLVVSWFRRAMPGRLRGQILIDPLHTVNAHDVTKPIGAAFGMNVGRGFADPDFVMMNAKLATPAAVRSLRAWPDQPVLVWTVRSAEQARIVKAAGVDNFVFEGFQP